MIITKKSLKYSEQAVIKELNFKSLVDLKDKLGREYKFGNILEKGEIERASVSGVHFVGCKFMNIDFGNIHFNLCEFERVEFNNCTFASVKFEVCHFIRSKFLGCILKDDVLLSYEVESSFRGCEIIQTRLQECDFSKIYVRDCNFKGASFIDNNLYYARFMDCTLNNFDIIKSNLTGVEFCANLYEGIILLNCEVDNNTRFDSYANELSKSYGELSLVFKQVYKLFRLNGFHEEASRYFYICREYERKALGYRGLWLLLQKLLWGYGERPANIVISCIFTIFTYSFLYLFSGIYFGGKLAVIGNDFMKNLENYFKCLYFSTITFTTVGYGDITPKAGISMFFSGTEALIGIIFTAIATASIFRKISKA